MPSYNYEYGGYTAMIHVSEDKRGRWSWTVTVDDAYWTMEDRPLPSEDIARSEAEHHAEWRIKNLLRNLGKEVPE